MSPVTIANVVSIVMKFIAAIGIAVIHKLPIRNHAVISSYSDT